MKYNKQVFCDMTNEKKLDLIKQELDLETHNATTKDDLLMMTDWLYWRIVKDDLKVEDKIVKEKSYLDEETFLTELDLLEITFTKVNVIDTARDLLNNCEKEVINGMSKQEIMAYYGGVENALSIVSTLLNSHEKNDFIINDRNMPSSKAEEFVYEDLLKDL